MKPGPSGEPAGYRANSHTDHGPDFTTRGLKKLRVLYMEGNQSVPRPHLTLIHLETSLLNGKNRQVDKTEKNPNLIRSACTQTVDLEKLREPVVLLCRSEM